MVKKLFVLVFAILLFFGVVVEFGVGLLTKFTAGGGGGGGASIIIKNLVNNINDGSFKKFLTILSSREWKEITANLPPGSRI